MNRNNFLKLTFVLAVSALLNLSCAPSLSSLTNPTNLLGQIGANPNLSSFNGLLNKVPNVGKLLGGKNPLTILAPSNEALAKLGPDALNQLTGSKKGLKELGNLLKGHIVPGNVSASDLANGTIKSLGGGNINLGNAKIIGDPIKSDNGTIQIIDSVLK